MSTSKRMISRRSFLKAVVRLGTLAVLWPGRTPVVGAVQAPAQLSAYGEGEYGQGPYSLYRITLPLIREG